MLICRVFLFFHRVCGILFIVFSVPFSDSFLLILFSVNFFQLQFRSVPPPLSPRPDPQVITDPSRDSINDYLPQC